MDGSSGFITTSKADWLRRYLRNTDRAIKIGDALSFIGPADIPTKISAHPYNESASFLIDAVGRSGGMALDVGAGHRGFCVDHLVQTEIAPFPNIDILCDAQALPFADNCFDLVMSFDVLEHVANPFVAASEIMRVMKPGGTLLIDVPFLQVEHGYPNHYTNFTRSGLRQLFAPLRCDAHVVPDSGHASHVVHTALHTFKSGIAKKDRDRFMSMTVGEILASPHKALLNAFRDGFADDVSWKMASSTQALFTKPGSDPLVGYDITDLPQFRNCAVMACT